MDEHEDKTKDTLRIIADNTEFLVCLTLERCRGLVQDLYAECNSCNHVVISLY